MRSDRPWSSSDCLTILAVIMLGFSTACASSETGPAQPPAKTIEPTATIAATATPTREPPPPENTPAPAEALQPYPYTTPLPPPTPTILDGIYLRIVPDKGTPVPCRRCAPYKAESGDWTLNLKAGAFRVSHKITNFQGVGSFTVSADQIAFFNDPNCHRDVGLYTWQLDGGSLTLAEVNDPCAFGLRAANLTAGTWVAADQQGRWNDPCQPPNLEAAVTGHWPAPAGCNPDELAHK